MAIPWAFVITCRPLPVKNGRIPIGLFMQTIRIAAAGIFASAVMSAQANACPMINGVFEFSVSKGDKIVTQRRTQYTRRNGDLFSYTIDKVHFQLADGVPQPILMGGKKGTVTVSCVGNSMTLEAQVDGLDFVHSRITRLSETELRIEDTVPDRTGIYVKVD
jgi:hypothetical protein